MAQLAIFDLDGTLVDQAGAARTWVSEFLDSWGLPASLGPGLVEHLTARRAKDRIFAQIVTELGLPIDGDQLWRQYRRRMPDLVRCFDGVAPALTRLRDAGWRVGIATNGMVDNQVGKMTRTGLSDLVDGWAVSSEVGVRKPDPGILRILAARIGCALTGWMVGDGVESDIACGTAAGLRTILISRGPAEAFSPQPDATAPTAVSAIARILETAA